jgi:hypothetical protein
MCYTVARDASVNLEDMQKIASRLPTDSVFRRDNHENSSLCERLFPHAKWSHQVMRSAAQARAVVGSGGRSCRKRSYHLSTIVSFPIYVYAAY